MVHTRDNKRPRNHHRPQRTQPRGQRLPIVSDRRVKALGVRLAEVDVLGHKHRDRRACVVADEAEEARDGGDERLGRGDGDADDRCGRENREDHAWDFLEDGGDGREVETDGVDVAGAGGQDGHALHDEDEAAEVAEVGDEDGADDAAHAAGLEGGRLRGDEGHGAADGGPDDHEQAEGHGDAENVVAGDAQLGGLVRHVAAVVADDVGLGDHVAGGEGHHAHVVRGGDVAGGGLLPELVAGGAGEDDDGDEAGIHAQHVKRCSTR